VPESFVKTSKRRPEKQEPGRGPNIGKKKGQSRPQCSGVKKGVGGEVARFIHLIATTKTEYEECVRSVGNETQDCARSGAKDCPRHRKWDEPIGPGHLNRRRADPH